MRFGCTPRSFGSSRNSGHSTALDGSGRLAVGWTENAWVVDLRAVWSRRLTGRCSLYALSGGRYTHARHNDFHAAGGVDRLCVVGKELASVELPVGVGLAHDRGSWSFYGDVAAVPDAGRRNPSAAVRDSFGGNRAVQSVNPGRCSLETNAGATWKAGRDCELRASYGFETSGDSTARQVRVGVNYAF